MIQPHVYVPDGEEEEENGAGSAGISELDIEDTSIGSPDQEEEEDDHNQDHDDGGNEGHNLEDLEEADDDEDEDEDDDDDNTLHSNTSTLAASFSPRQRNAAAEAAASFISPSSSSPSSGTRPSMPARSQSTSALSGHSTTNPANPTQNTNHTNSNSNSNSNSNPFAPPFYNRPPTPLPPSPSLTSLLRPAFSSTSRQTTPDSSDVETTATANEHDDVVAAVAPAAKSAASTAPSTTTVARVSPKIPTYEYYGFVLYLGSGLAFLIYLLWSYLPSPFLHQLGIYYYPDRWWSLAIPSYLVMLVVYIYVALASYNTGYLTLPMTSIECIVDEAASVASIAIPIPGRPSYSSALHASRSAPDLAAGGRRGRWVRGMPESGGGGGGVVQEGGGSAMGSWRGEKRREEGGGKAMGLSRELGVGAGEGVGRGRGRDEGRRTDWKALWDEGTDAVLDVPIGGVCEILYRD